MQKNWKMNRHENNIRESHLAICLKWNFRLGLLFLIDSRPFFQMCVFTVDKDDKIAWVPFSNQSFLAKPTRQLLIFKWRPEIIRCHFLVKNLQHRGWHGSAAAAAYVAVEIRKTKKCCRSRFIWRPQKLTEQSTPNRRDIRCAIWSRSHGASWSSRWPYDDRQSWRFASDMNAILQC